MVTITLGNSISLIQGLSAELDKALREHLSYKIGSFHSAFGVRKKSMLSKRGEFLTGLSERIMIFLAINGVKPKIINKKTPFNKKPSIKPVLPHTPYQQQNEAAAWAILNNGIISMTTGSGKSTVIALIAAQLNVKTLVVVPTLNLKKQLTASLLEALKGKSDIVVENIDSSRLKTMTNFDLLIIDEMHHSAAKTYQTLNKRVWNNIPRRVGLTATPFRNNPEENLLLESICGPVLYELPYKQAATQGLVAKLEAYYYEVVPTPTEAHTWAQVYSELVVNNDKRNETIALTMLRLNASQKSTLCLVKEVAHGRKLAEMTGFPLITGEDEESRDYIRQFNNGEIMAVIATTGMCGEGVDTRACEYVIIAGLGKAKSQLMQQFGRAVRNYPGKDSGKIVLFRDKSHRFTLRHYRDQAKILKDEYGIIPVKLEI